MPSILRVESTPTGRDRPTGQNPATHAAGPLTGKPCLRCRGIRPRTPRADTLRVSKRVSRCQLATGGRARRLPELSLGQVGVCKRNAISRTGLDLQGLAKDPVLGRSGLPGARRGGPKKRLPLIVGWYRLMVAHPGNQPGEPALSRGCAHGCGELPRNARFSWCGSNARSGHSTLAPRVAAFSTQAVRSCV